MKKIKSHEEEKKDIISMKICNFNENTRVHVLASNFVSSDDLMCYTKLNSVVKNSIVSEQFRLSQWKNAFMSNRKLGDEFRYVFDRRYLKRFTGNSLDKPQILLKRMKIRDTTYEEEVVGLGDKYQSLFLGENKKMDYPQLHVEHSVCGSPGYSPQNACLYRMESKGSNFAYPYRQTLQIANKQKYYNSGPTNYRDSLVSDQYKSYLNFLKHAGLVRSNLTPDKNGNLSFSIPSGRYTKLSAIVCDMENVVQVDVELPTKNYILNKRNLALLKPLDPKKHYNEIRKTVNFLKGEKIKITDISTTYYNVVDSIDKVKKLQLEIAKMDGCDICPDLLFLANWDKLSLEDKNKKYSSYFCHETNLFLYFKDREFFNQVVQPFIMNKYEKSIIDNWLLGNYEKIESLASVEFYDNLNAIEKILLIYILVLKEDTVEIAKRLVERIKLNSEAVEENQEYRNICFDAVINTLKEEDLKSKKSECHEIISDEDEFHKRSLPLIPTEDIPMSPSYVHCQNNIVKLNQHISGTQNIRGRSAKHTARKSVGGKGLKRKRIAEEENDDSFDESYEELNDLFDEDREARRKIRTNFQRMEMPSEYCETHYYASISINRPDLVLDNKFWLDLANHLIEKRTFDNFMSGNFVLVSSNISEIIFSCAVLDLPFTSGAHITKAFEDKGIKIKLEDNAMLFKKEIKKAKAEIENNIHVIHRYFEYGNEQSEKKIKEFLVHQIYCCEVIITNVSNKTQEFQLLWQIPEGSLPLLNITYQKSENHKLEPYSTTAFKYHFYFPSEGSFIHFPSNVSIQDKVVAVSNVSKFKVVTHIKEVVIETFKDILMTGDKNSIYDFIKTSNLLQDKKGFSFQLIFWMLKEKEVFEKIINILRERRIYVQTVWEFGFLHKNVRAIKEYISKSEKLCNIIGSNFKSSLYENFFTKFKPRHLEYFPHVNARAHNCGDQSRSNILNNEFRRQYNAYLVNSIEKTKLDNSDKMCLTYFLLLQDRINEAIEIFQQVSKDEIKYDGGLQLQFDYMTAYLDFYLGCDTNYTVARDIVEKYKDYPVLHWKFLFEEIKDQLAEFDGDMDVDHEINQEDEDSKERNLKKSKGLEPYLSAELKNK